MCGLWRHTRSVKSRPGCLGGKWTSEWRTSATYGGEFVYSFFAAWRVSSNPRGWNVYTGGGRPPPHPPRLISCKYARECMICCCVRNIPIFPVVIPRTHVAGGGATPSRTYPSTGGNTPQARTRIICSSPQCWTEIGAHGHTPTGSDHLDRQTMPLSVEPATSWLLYSLAHCHSPAPQSTLSLSLSLSLSPISEDTIIVLRTNSHQLLLQMVWYGIVEFNVPLDTV